MNETMRHNDARVNEIETIIENMGKDLGLVKQKIFNGFSNSIQSTENKVDYIDNENKAAHKELKDNIKDLSKKFDKILWMFGAGAVTIIIKEIIQGLL